MAMKMIMITVMIMIVIVIINRVDTRILNHVRESFDKLSVG